MLSENERKFENENEAFLNLNQKIPKNREISIIKPDEEENDKKVNLDNEFKKNILEDVIKEIKFSFIHYILGFILIIYILTEGFVMIGTSLIVPVLAEGWKLNEIEKSFMGGSIFIGFFIGSILSGFLSDNYGRKFGFVFGCLLSTIGSFFCYFSNSYINIIITNIIIGLGVGISIPSILSLCTEITGIVERNRIIAWIWIMFVLGEFLGCYIAKAYNIFEFSNNNWKMLLSLRGIGVILIFIFNFLVFDKYSYVLFFI